MSDVKRYVHVGTADRLVSVNEKAEGCPNCHGSGLVEATSPEALARGDEQEPCADCRGTGCAASEKEGGK